MTSLQAASAGLSFQRFHIAPLAIQTTNGKTIEELCDGKQIVNIEK